MGLAVRAQPREFTGRARRVAADTLHIQRYFYEDPIRFLTIVCAVLLIFVPYVPWWLIALTVSVSQFNGLAMAVRLMGGERLFSRLGAGHTRTWTVQSLGTESFTLSSCMLLGGLLLMRLFGPPEPVLALGIMTIALALVPDVRVCRWMMPSDPFRANRSLERGTFLRDPAKLGAILTAFVLCLLDPESVFFVMISLAILQFNSVMVFLDKYVQLVRWRRKNPTGVERALPLTRDAWRMLLCILPLGILPLRHAAGDEAGWYGAGAVVGLVALPDIFRLLVLLYTAFFSASAAAARRARKRLVVGAARARLEAMGLLYAVPGIARVVWGGLHGAWRWVARGRGKREPAPVVKKEEPPQTWESVRQ